VSRPRKPYGQNPPGRLLGTMIKVLAAEMSDQGRLARGKRYWADDAVRDIVIGHGAVTAEIQGSRQQPYIVTIEAGPGTGVPGRREVWAQCTCPDDTGTGVDLCKHAVAAFFALADEVTIEPDLVDRWRRSARPTPGSDHAVVSHLSTPAHADDVEDDDDALTGDVLEFRPRVVAEVDLISRLLQPPAGALAPTFPEVTDRDHGVIRHQLLAAVLDDALEHLTIRWE
jgi:SWIM zinc finger